MERQASALEKRFHKAMLTIYQKAWDECRYPANRFLAMLAERGGTQTAKDLLGTSKQSEGFTALWERGRLDLTVEALVLENPEWHPLFTEKERRIARDRLTAYGYVPKVK